MIKRVAQRQLDHLVFSVLVMYYIPEKRPFFSSAEADSCVCIHNVTFVLPPVLLQ